MPRWPLRPLWRHICSENRTYLTWWWWFSCFSPCLTLVILWTVAPQAPLSKGFPRQEYWSWVASSFSRGSSWLRDAGSLLHCRWILYWLSHKETPYQFIILIYKHSHSIWVPLYSHLRAHGYLQRTWFSRRSLLYLTQQRYSVLFIY